MANFKSLFLTFRTDQLLHDKFLWKNPIPVNEAAIVSVETDTYVESSLKVRTFEIRDTFIPTFSCF